MARRVWTMLLIGVWWLGGGLVIGASQSPPSGTGPAPDQPSLEKVRRSIGAVGQILVRPQSPGKNSFEPRGSAVIVRAEGVVVTSLHVIQNEKNHQVEPEVWLSFSSSADMVNGSVNLFQLSVLTIDAKQDLAILKIVSDTNQCPVAEKAVFPYIEIGTQKLQLLDQLVIVGYPAKGGPTVTVNQGIVEGIDERDHWIKTNARLIHGNSGGAAVNTQGQLVGIPTKVVFDKQLLDTNGDGLPDKVETIGGIGYLRPVRLVEALLAELDRKSHTVESPSQPKETKIQEKKNPEPGLGSGFDRSEASGKIIYLPLSDSGSQPEEKQRQSHITRLIPLRGVIQVSGTTRPIADVRVGLLKPGSREVNTETLLAWGQSDSKGQFELNRPVLPGHYVLRVVADGYQPFTCDLEITATQALVQVDLVAHP